MAIRTENRGLRASARGLRLSVLLFLLAGQTVLADRLQHPRIELISVDDGLPHGTVYSITQDAIGFLWFGTEDGLARYDGYDFTVFFHDPADPSSVGPIAWPIAMFAPSSRTDPA